MRGVDIELAADVERRALVELGGVDVEDPLLAVARRAAGLLGYERALSALPSPASPLPVAAPTPTPAPAAAREPAAVLRLEGEIWTVIGRAGVVRLRDRKGLQYLATLLEHPDVEVHAMDLVTGGRAPPTASRASSTVGAEGVSLSDATR